MASSINASTTAGLVNTADTSGVLQLQTAGVTAISIDASQAVSFTNSPTVTGGTANGVAYLNGSKVLTTGSALVFDGSKLGINTASPQRTLSIANGGPVVEIDPAGIGSANPIYFNYNRTTSVYTTPQYWALAHNWMVSGGTQAMTLDASGNLLVGSTSISFATGNKSIEVNGTGDSAFNVSVGGTNYGYLYTSTSSTILGTRQSIPLVFSTANTERARIDTSGNAFFSGNYTVSYPGSGNTTTGIFLESAGQFCASRDNTVVGRFNRNTSDGTLISFARQGTEIGTISVSGGVVSYNAFAGSHWSQLSDGSKPDILRGTVLDSINELVQWPDEPTTERLCKVKVSDTAGSKKVYGVFMDWDNDWTATNDMYVTAVGAFICRVNASVTVQEGDLLESNGDGTARVQADDIIRSSTIGKVTCTEKTHQYDDGSYCVPTVLYCG